MKTLTLKQTLALSLVGIALSASSSFAASIKDDKIGTLNVTVVDQNGAVVSEAPVYIYGEHKTHFIGGKEIPGTNTFTMAAGEYRISTALVKRTGDYTDRFASHEAHIQVLEGDNTCVILTLRPINDPMGSLTYAEVHKMGVSSDIARNFN